MKKTLLATLSILIFVGSVAIPGVDSSACGNISCYTTDFDFSLLNPSLNFGESNE